MPRTEWQAETPSGPRARTESRLPTARRCLLVGRPRTAPRQRTQRGRVDSQSPRSRHPLSYHPATYRIPRQQARALSPQQRESSRARQWQPLFWRSFENRSSPSRVLQMQSHGPSALDGERPAPEAIIRNALAPFRPHSHRHNARDATMPGPAHSYLLRTDKNSAMMECVRT